MANRVMEDLIRVDTLQRAVWLAWGIELTPPDTFLDALRERMAVYACAKTGVGTDAALIVMKMHEDHAARVALKVHEDLGLPPVHACVEDLNAALHLAWAIGTGGDGSAPLQVGDAPYNDELRKRMKPFHTLVWAAWGLSLNFTASVGVALLGRILGGPKTIDAARRAKDILEASSPIEDIRAGLWAARTIGSGIFTGEFDESKKKLNDSGLVACSATCGIVLQIYIAGAYTAPKRWEMTDNVHRARAVAVQVLRTIPGTFPIVPHQLDAGFEDECTYEQVLEGTMEVMRRSDAVLVVESPNLSGSKGAHKEILECKRLNIPLFYTVEGLRQAILDGVVIARRGDQRDTATNQE